MKTSGSFPAPLTALALFQLLTANQHEPSILEKLSPPRAGEGTSIAPMAGSSASASRRGEAVVPPNDTAGNGTGGSAGQIANAAQGNYPASVTKSGLQSVWDQRTTVGLRTTRTLTPAANAASLPPGVSLSGSTLTVSQNASLSQWDFSGYTVVVDGNINVAFTDCKFAHSGAPSVLDIGTNSGVPTVTCNHCEFNLTGVTELFESPIRDYSGDFYLQNSYLHGAPVDYVTQTSTGTFVASNNYVTSPGMASRAGDHVECFHLRAGTSILSQNLFDVTNGAGHVAANTMTGIVYSEGLNGAVNTTMTQNILVGAADIGSIYAMQISNSNDGVTFTMDNNVVQGGSGGGTTHYIAVNGGSLSGSGNVDFDTASSTNLVPV